MVLRIRALGLDFKLQRTKTADGLWRALRSALDSKRPILLFNWTPNWVEARVKGKFVEFPSYHPDCETKASWGVNSKMVMDCGKPEAGMVEKGCLGGDGTTLALCL